MLAIMGGVFNIKGPRKDHSSTVVHVAFTKVSAQVSTMMELQSLIEMLLRKLVHHKVRVIQLAPGLLV